MTRRARTIVVAVCTAALCPAAAAQAAAPPRGTYDCRYVANNASSGTIKVRTSKRYAFNGKRGRYATTRRKIRFRTGPLKGVYNHAVWRRASGITYINLYDGTRFGERDADAHCIKRKG